MEKQTYTQLHREKQPLRSNIDQQPGENNTYMHLQSKTVKTTKKEQRKSENNSQTETEETN